MSPGNSMRTILWSLQCNIRPSCDVGKKRGGNPTSSRIKYKRGSAEATTMRKDFNDMFPVTSASSQRIRRNTF